MPGAEPRDARRDGDAREHGRADARVAAQRADAIREVGRARPDRARDVEWIGHDLLRARDNEAGKRKEEEERRPYPAPAAGR